jgi:ABC-type transport system substrate-binding protein
MLPVKSATQATALILALAVIFLAARRYGAQYFSEPLDEPLSFALGRDAAALNATLPEMVSQGVRLDKASAGPGNAFSYVYTIVDDAAAAKILGDPKELESLKTQLRERVCTIMPEYRDNGTVVTYTLKNGSGVSIADIAIDPADC